MRQIFGADSLLWAEGIMQESNAREQASQRPVEGAAPSDTQILDDANEAAYPVRPSDIKIKGKLWDAFDNTETEISAGWIVNFCRERGSWKPFTLEELTAYYQAGRKREESFHFNRLIDPGYSFSIVRGSYRAGGGWIVVRDGKYHVTADFIERCLKSTQS